MTDPFSRASLENLSISRFIFHLVHDDSSEPILLDEMSCDTYEDFFLDLVFDCLRGTRYRFHDNSQTERVIREMYEDGDMFERGSRQLAINFHAASSGPTSPGIFFVLQLTNDVSDYFALIKYDNQTVLQYQTTDGANATIAEIANAITRDRRALQKSALIAVNAEGAEIIARDRQASAGDLAHYFKGFLNVSRYHTEQQVTKALHQAVVETVNRHPDDLPDDLIRDASSHFSKTVERRPQNTDAFFSSYFGPKAGDQVRTTFEQQLQRRGLNDCRFELDSATAQNNDRRRYRTAGGITFQVPGQSDDWFALEDCPDGKIQVTIRTRRLWER